MDKFEILAQFGLSENETRLYLRLLELGTATTGRMMKELNLYSKTVYELLDKLQERGLVSYVMISKIKHFEAATPERLLDLLYEEKDILQSLEKDLKRIMPELKKSRRLANDPEHANLQKDLDFVLDAALKSRDVLAYGGSEYLRTLLMIDGWHKKRNNLGINMKIILHKDLRRNKLKYKALAQRFTATEQPVSVLILGDTVAQISWSREPVATICQSKTLAKQQKDYFLENWKKAKP